MTVQVCCCCGCSLVLADVSEQAGLINLAAFREAHMRCVEYVQLRLAKDVLRDPTPAPTTAI